MSARPAPVPFAPGVHTYPGSCHCGAVRFEADIDLSAGTTRCNCTWCIKHGRWGVMIRPDAFRLLAGQAHLETVPLNPFSQRSLCRTCRLDLFNAGDIPQLGGPTIGINVRCLDGVDLRGVPVFYLDGLHDTWALLGTRPWQSPFSADDAAPPAG